MYTLEIPEFFSKDGALKSDLLSMSYGVTGRQLGHPNFGTGAIKITEVSLTRNSDNASNLFLSHLVHGTVFPAVTITSLKKADSGPNQVPYYIFTLKEAIVSSFQLSGRGGDLPTESITFNCKEAIGKSV